ncbi:methyltransferase (DUF5641) [Popillia japonica]|uniref:Methyltransferase (DUF5641) n=1 Tax=Popillia japonica TaxID=7064 RepID=A0AAW1KE48_POPJA
MNSGSSLEEGHLVLIKDENLPPMKWKLGRVLSLHFGNDDVAKVVTIKTVSVKLMSRAEVVEVQAGKLFEWKEGSPFLRIGCNKANLEIRLETSEDYWDSQVLAGVAANPSPGRKSTFRDSQVLAGVAANPSPGRKSTFRPSSTFSTQSRHIVHRSGDFNM